VGYPALTVSTPHFGQTSLDVDELVQRMVEKQLSIVLPNLKETIKA
jgi:hypothetical protein